MKFTDTHEWLKIKNGIATIGITNHAQDNLGDIVYVELPELGLQIEKEESLGVVESVKSASDLYAPISGIVIEINEELTGSPEVLNLDPHNDGWLVKIKVTDVVELRNLLNVEEYEKLLAEESVE